MVNPRKSSLCHFQCLGFGERQKNVNNKARHIGSYFAVSCVEWNGLSCVCEVKRGSNVIYSCWRVPCLSCTDHVLCIMLSLYPAINDEVEDMKTMNSCEFVIASLLAFFWAFSVKPRRTHSDTDRVSFAPNQRTLS